MRYCAFMFLYLLYHLLPMMRIKTIQ